MLDSFKIDLKAHKRAFIFCAISSIGALCYGYDNTYYTGILGMTPFKNDYGDHLDADGNKALAVSFTSFSTSAIYIGDAVGALLSAPVNDWFGRKGSFWCKFHNMPHVHSQD